MIRYFPKVPLPPALIRKSWWSKLFDVSRVRNLTINQVESHKFEVISLGIDFRLPGDKKSILDPVVAFYIFETIYNSDYPIFYKLEGTIFARAMHCSYYTFRAHYNHLCCYIKSILCVSLRPMTIFSRRALSKGGAFTYTQRKPPPLPQSLQIPQLNPLFTNTSFSGERVEIINCFILTSASMKQKVIHINSA